MKLDLLDTEQRNPKTRDIDKLDAAGIVKTLNDGDRSVADAVAGALPYIAKAAEAAARSISGSGGVADGKSSECGGRLIYIGAGTSGRLGVLDAVECRPTFGAPDGVVVGIIAGGIDAMFRAVEGAEDSAALGEEDLRGINVSPADTVVGIASSGRTPYVIGALKYARLVGCTTVALSCVKNALISEYADIKIEAVTGAEAVTGSTRMKAGTAQKMILNMISTTAFILMGKVYGNLMIDVQPTNEKLVARAVRIIREITGRSEADAESLLTASGMRVKYAVVMGMCGVDAAEAEILLESSGGNVRRVIESRGNE